VMDEQGLGDTIMFMRFLKPLVEQGVEINFVTHEILFDLIRTMNLPINLLPSNKPGSVNGATGWTPLLHIPRAHGIDPKTYGDGIPYISADPKRVKDWAAKLDKKSFKIGVCWGGNPDSPAEKGRSMPLEALAPLAALTGVKLYSLQKGAPLKQLNGVSFRDSLVDFGDDLDAGGQAFLDTAAIMMSMDLIVTVCTSIAHVAGALGRPVHVLLRREPDWRWLARESDTVWYPSMTLFRQRTTDEWSEPMALVVNDVRVRMAPTTQSNGISALPLVRVSPGELVDQLISFKRQLGSRIAEESEAKQRYDEMLLEWNKLIEINPLLNSIQVELEEIYQDLAQVESHIAAFEVRQELGSPFLEKMREARQLNAKRLDRIRRVDALLRSIPEAAPEKTATSGQRKANKKSR